jgi:hypothetical protein
MDLLRKLVTRVVNILFAFDCALFALCTLGGSYPYESFSSAAYRGELHNRIYGKIARPTIDGLFTLLGQKEHCRYAYYYSKFNLPEDMR